jgi:acetoin utilization protein AcuB
VAINLLMSKNVITLDVDDNLTQAKHVFDQHKIHHILIIENKKLVGVITDRDLYKHLSPQIGTHKETLRDTSLLRKKLHLIMSRELVTATKETSLNAAVVLFYDNHISCLPIVDEQFHPVGIVSWRDIIKIIAIQYRKKLDKENGVINII